MAHGQDFWKKKGPRQYSFVKKKNIFDLFINSFIH